MSRELKFRAWDTVEQIMIPSVYGSHNSASDILQGEGRFEVMQFTGLRDKNGREVYEGDIVKCEQGCPHEVVWVKEMGGTYIGGMPGFNLNGLTMSGGVGYAWTGKEEVIGNIYEHPELLK